MLRFWFCPALKWTSVIRPVTEKRCRLKQVPLPDAILIMCVGCRGVLVRVYDETLCRKIDQQKYDQGQNFYFWYLPKCSSNHTKSWHTPLLMNIWRKVSVMEHLLLVWLKQGFHINYNLSEPQCLQSCVKCCYTYMYRSSTNIWNVVEKSYLHQSVKKILFIAMNY